MNIGDRIDETGMLLREGGGFCLRRDRGDRFLLDLRRTPVDDVEQRVRVVGTYVGDALSTSTACRCSSAADRSGCSAPAG